MTPELEALKRTATRLTGKRIVDVSRAEQTLDEIQANTFQDLLHELSHWLIASPEERLYPNLGLPGFNQFGEIQPFEAVRESQAIYMHSAIAHEIEMDEEELDYVSYLEEAAGIYTEAMDLSVSPKLHKNLSGPMATLVAQTYAQELQALEEA